MAYGRVGGTSPPVDWEGDAGPLPFEVGARVVEWRPGAPGALLTWVESAERREEGSELALDGRTPPPSRLSRLLARLLSGRP